MGSSGKGTDLPGIFRILLMPLEHLPIYHCARKDVDLEVVFRLRVPQLWCLPVDCPDQTSDHRPSRLFDFGESEVCDLGDAFVGDENVGGFAIPVDDRWLVVVEILDPTGDVEHHTHLPDA